jgi:hypothetical protein
MANNAQLNDQLSKMINEFNKQRESGLICDTECQNDQNIRNWQHKVTNRETTLSTASQDLLKAQRTLASYDKSYRATFAKNISDMADTTIDKLQDEFDRSKRSILQNLDFYDTQMAFKNKMQDIKDYQQNRLNDVSGNVARNIGGTAVNQRLASFYSKQTGLVGRTIAYVRIIYWTLFSIQVIAALMMFRKTKKNRTAILLGIVLLVIFPLYNTLSPIFENIWQVLKLFPSP